ncbi:MAG: GEVED domain-containing protein, partial [Ferruginibacter sp.]
TTLSPGVTYNLSIGFGVAGAYTGAIVSVWFDWNKNNVFEASEWIQPASFINISTLTTTTITVPSNAVLGVTRMRIRSRGNGNTNGSGDACNTGFGSGNSKDFDITIGTTSGGGTQPPIANFYAPDTVWINSPATLINTSSNQSRVFWDFPNENPLNGGLYRQAGFIDTAKFFNNITYTFTSPGLKLVKLLAVNNLKRDSLRDSISKYIYVDTPSLAPRADFISFKRIMGITEEAQFVDLTSNGPTQWEWTVDPPCISCITDPANGIPNYFITGTGQQGQNVSNPRLAAFDPGIFSICLRVWNLRGTDSICKSTYMKVVQGNYMCSGAGANNSTEFEGYLYGISGPYQTYARSSWSPSCPGFTINPCADSITLYVERIKMWPSDSIQIYNGPSSSSPLLRTIGAGSAGQIPLTVAQSVIKGGNTLFFRYKPGSVALPANYDSASFIIRWLAKPASYPKPTTVMIMPDTVYSNQLVSYKSASTGTLMKYSWDTDGNNLFDSTTANTNRTFLITVPVLRKICLVTYNCIGFDTFCKQVAFLPVNRPPIAYFTADKTIGFNTDTFNMIDQTVNGVVSWRWTFIPSAVQYMNGTTQFSQNPQVRLTSPVPYTVRLTTTNAFGTDSNTKVSFINVNAYQTPGTGTSFAGVADNTMGISRVRLAGIDSSFADPTSPAYQYINNASQVATMYRGGKYAVILNRPKDGSPLDHKIWMDKNYNADFATNELILNKTNNGDVQMTDTIMISATQAYGSTRMRVGVDLANSTQFNSVYSVIGMFKDFNINIKRDNVKPTIQLNGTTIIRTEINKTFPDPGVTALDNIEGDISLRVQKISTIDTANIGVYNVKYFVTDYSGNVSDTLLRTVIVELNSTGPSITLIGGSVYRTNVKEIFIDPSVVALDNNGNVITSNVIMVSNLNTE